MRSDSENNFWRLLADYEALTQQETLAIRHENFPALIEAQRLKTSIFPGWLQLGAQLGISREASAELSYRLDDLTSAENDNVLALNAIKESARKRIAELAQARVRLHHIRRNYHEMKFPTPPRWDSSPTADFPVFMDQRDVALADAPPTVAAEAEHAAGSAALHAAIGSEATRQLTLGLVHEMNNVLGGIAVLSEIYQDRSGADDGLGEGLALIHRSTGRLQTLIGQLKILNGPTVEEPVYLNLSGTVRTMFEMFAPLLPKTLTVETAFPMEELAVHLDQARLRRVLLNLTLNLRDDLNRHPEAAGTLRVGIRHRGGSVELNLSASSQVSGLPAKFGAEQQDCRATVPVASVSALPATGTVALQPDLSRVSDLAPLTADARARLEDARQCLGEMGGTLIALTQREFILAIPLVV